MPLPTSIRATVETLLAALPIGDDAKLTADRARTLALVRDTPAPAARDQFAPGHLTASGIVLDPGHRRVLVVFHERLQRWLQPGGHLEASDDGPLAAARREVREETGVELDPTIPPRLCGVDVHEIPAARGEPTHLHHDLLFRLVARNERVRPSVESPRVAWVPLDQLTAYDLDAPLLRNIARALADG